ncbi:hypothetical protein PF008_g15499 [Phytophthora fragariae]|uniref:Uncharacterized protein n=1 Tax=Phytophthora fragariae TaxID=53985 RepID=A0A6G0RED8_9STRA|nr:hypothetical protein PF008_g15499 [Phytophthora fragariae]
MTTRSAKKAEVILGSDNYFHWEFAMRMTLARKGLLAHVQVVKDPAEITEAWLLNDIKALGLTGRSGGAPHQDPVGDVGHHGLEHVVRLLLSDDDAQPGDDDPPPPRVQDGGRRDHGQAPGQIQ